MAKTGVKPKFSDAEILAAVRELGGVVAAARKLGQAPSNISQRIKAIRKSDAPLASPVPDRERPIDELLAARESEFKRRDESERAVASRTVTIGTDLPIAIAHMGDPHLDNPGCDIATIRRHLDTINATPGFYAANVGDYSDNWVGRLSHLYSQSTVTGIEAKRLVEWYFNQCHWLYLVGGNHDAWNQGNDLLAWFANQAGVLFQPSQIRFRLRFKNDAEVSVLVRHGFKGFSIYSSGHGVARAAKFGRQDDILAGGHIHASDYRQIWHSDLNKLSHCLQVGSYKRWDDYAVDGQFEPCWTPVMVTVIDPRDTNPLTKVTVFFSVERAAEYLTWLRGKTSQPRPVPKSAKRSRG